MIALLLEQAGGAACGRPPPPLPAPAELLRPFGCAAPPVAVARPRVDLYLDASVSMRGFMTPGGGYPRMLEDLLGRLASGGFPSRVHAVCEDACSQPVEAAAGEGAAVRVLSPGFYNGQRTPLAQVLGRIAREGQQGRAALLISDLEQSDAHTDQRTLVDAFRLLAERTPHLLLLAFQSDFASSHSSPSRSSRHGARAHGTAPLPAIPRRFYLLAVAPSAAALSELEQRVLRHLNAGHTFQPTLTPIVVKEVRPLGGGDPVWGAFRKQQELPCDRDPVRFASFLERRPPRDPGEGALQLRLTGDLQAPLHALSDLRYEVRRPGGATAFTLSARQNPKEPGTVVLSVPAPRPAPHSWDSYRVRVRTGGGNLEVPAWVKEATGPMERGQTPHLDHLVRAMQQAITEDVVFLDLLLAFGRGE